jgi:hypothetical protein
LNQRIQIAFLLNNTKNTGKFYLDEVLMICLNQIRNKLFYAEKGVSVFWRSVTSLFEPEAHFCLVSLFGIVLKRIESI